MYFLRCSIFWKKKGRAIGCCFEIFAKTWICLGTDDIIRNGLWQAPMVNDACDTCASTDVCEGGSLS
jgi:hypothetical protein